MWESEWSSEFLLIVIGEDSSSFQNVLLGHMEPGFLGTSVFDMFESLEQAFNVFIIVFVFVTWESMSPHCHDDLMSWYIVSVLKK